MGRVPRLKLDDEDGYSNNNKGREGKCGTTTTPSTAKNATRKDKKKSRQPRRKTKKITRRIPPLCWVVVLSHRLERLLIYFE